MASRIMWLPLCEEQLDGKPRISLPKNFMRILREKKSGRRYRGDAHVGVLRMLLPK
jgi:hypothetical protein